MSDTRTRPPAGRPGTRPSGRAPGATGPRVVSIDDVAPEVPTVVVDPRFRERRIAVRKDAGRRRLKRLLVLVGLAVTALAAVIVLRSPVLDVDEVAITGAARTGDAQVHEVAGIDVGAPLLLVDLGAASQAIEALPWVAEAEVTRELPGIIEVQIREREPVAVVSGSGRAVLVDGTGQVLADAPPADPSDPSAPFVHVVAPAAPPAVGRVVDRDLATAIDLAGRLRVNPAGAVAAVHLEPALRLQLVTGAVVELGDASGIDAKIEAFRTVHARVDATCLEAIDLTVPTHPVVTRGSC